MATLKLPAKQPMIGTESIKFSDFFANTVLPLIGKGAKDALRNARMYEAALVSDVSGEMEIPDGLFVEIRKALEEKQLNQAVAFRLAPYLALFVEE